MAIENLANVCPYCWSGQLRQGSCTHCHRKAEGNRRSDALPLGTILKNRYTVGQVLGNGGFGITYSAWDRHSGCRVALKEMFPATAAHRATDRMTVVPAAEHAEFFRELQERFEREAQLLLQLRGRDNLIQVYDLFRCNGTAYYAMEFLEGCDLQAYCKSHGPMSWNTLAPMMREVLQVLGGLHRMNLIHRDVSPDNLFLTNDNHVHLIDFGSVRTYNGNSHFTTHLKDAFAPWEQYISNGNQGPWTDIYSLSVTMYLLLTGNIPPNAGARKNGAQVTPLRTLAPAVPEYVAAAIEKGMSVSISQRFQTAESFLAALGLQSSAGAFHTAVPPTVVPHTHTLGFLRGQSGIYAGRHRPLETDTEITIGRGAECLVRFPDHTQGVSRRQCAVYVRSDGQLFVRDLGSSYGSYLNQQKLAQGWTQAPWGSVLWFGNESFRLMKDNPN